MVTISMPNIDTIIDHSIRDFLADIRNKGWFGREREAISLFVFSQLIKHIIHTRIMIEGAVPQLKTLGKELVCKDIVIWEKPYMTCWNKGQKLTNYPLAIMEWKVDISGKNKPPDKFVRDDIKWLAKYSSEKDNITGYSFYLDINSTGKPAHLTIIKDGIISNTKDFR